MARRFPIRAEVPAWYAINANSERKKADVYIYDAIGGWFGVDARSFVSEVADLDVDQINLYVNSPGGDVFDGMAIANVLRRHKATVVATVDGIAASAASYIVQAADEIVMGRGSEMMIHDASGFCFGNAKDMTDTSDILERISNDIAGLYADRAGGTAEDWRTAMREETWYSASEAVEAGLADRVDGSRDDTDAKNAFDLSVFAHAGRAKAPAPFMPAQSPAARLSNHPKFQKRDPDPNKPLGMATVLNASGKPEPVLTAEQADSLLSAHQPPAEPAETHQEGADPMSDALKKEIGDRLGIPADTELTDETVLEALDEVLAEQDNAPTAASAPAHIPDGTVLLDKATHDQLVAAANDLRTVRATKAEEDRVALVENAISDGKIAPARRQHWIDQLTADPGAAEVLDALAPGTIPVDDAGYTGGVDEANDEDAIYAKYYPNQKEG